MSGSVRNVLLVEDDDGIAEMLSDVFDIEGYRLLHASSGEDAVHRIRIREPAVVLLDINLPGIDGIETCRVVRTISEVPIIMLTARDTEIDKVLSLEIGADDYVTKPFSPRELLARTKAVIRRTETPQVQPKVLEVGPYEIDGARRMVTKMSDSTQIVPTAREFDLLWFLADNLGLVMSRPQILKSVWGYEFFGETRTVDVHVKQLRKKLPDLPLETVWGVGYRLGD